MVNIDLIMSEGNDMLSHRVLSPHNSKHTLIISITFL